MCITPRSHLHCVVVQQVKIVNIFCEETEVIMLTIIIFFIFIYINTGCLQKLRDSFIHIWYSLMSTATVK